MDHYTASQSTPVIGPILTSMDHYQPSTSTISNICTPFLSESEGPSVNTVSPQPTRNVLSAPNSLERQPHYANLQAAENGRIVAGNLPSSRATQVGYQRAQQLVSSHDQLLEKLQQLQVVVVDPGIDPFRYCRSW